MGDGLPCRSEPVATQIMSDVGRNHGVCPGSQPDSQVYHIYNSRCLLGQQVDYLAQISRPTAAFSPIPQVRSEVNFPIIFEK